MNEVIRNRQSKKDNQYMANRVNEWVSEWVLFNANFAISQLYHGENKLIFNEMTMSSALY